MALSEHLLAHRPQKSKSNLIKASPVYIPSFAILLAIGFIRELFVHIFDYGHSTTEYGEHWNFFITLGFLKLFTTVLPYPYSIPVGLLIGAAYQASLNLGLEAFIMRPDRDEYNIFDANREGICSLFGYIFAYCLTLIVIRIVAFVDGIFTPSPKSVTLIMISGVIVYCLQVQSMWMFGQPSRRIANTPYTLAMLCMKVIILGLLQIVQLFGVPKNGENGKSLQKNSENVNGNGFQPSLLEAISRNCLWFFLIANLGTGLVNLSISTHRVYSTVVQMTVLIVYCFAICLIIYLWHMYNNRKKPNTKSNSASLLNIAIGK
uniref:Uncharacterized protein n=1 Tax=Acrobeloides nanus TaxID=290746 RepID=A0A914DPW6_9BILA